MEGFEATAPDAAAGWAGEAGAAAQPGEAATPIERDTPCRKCGYNLRGLTADGRCPECGTSVGYSLQGDLLRFCDPGWVDTLRRGVKLIIVAVAVGMSGVVVGFAAAIGGGGAALSVILFLMSCLLILGMILATIGWWLLTSPDPSGLGEDQYGGARKTIRVAQVVGVIQLGLGYLSTLLTFSDEMLIVIRAVMLIGALVSIVGMVAECAYLEKLARRIPDDRLSKRAHFLMWALGGTYGLLQLTTIVLELAGAAGFSCFTGILYLIVLVFFVMFLLLLERIGKRFKEAAEAARQTWASQPFGQGDAPQQPAHGG